MIVTGLVRDSHQVYIAHNHLGVCPLLLFGSFCLVIRFCLSVTDCFFVSSFCFVQPQDLLFVLGLYYLKFSLLSGYLVSMELALCL